MSVEKMCPHVQQILNKIRLVLGPWALSGVGEGTKGGCPGRVRGQWGVFWVGEGTKGGCQGRVRGPWGVVRGG